jgi:CheY-like chemotaxis protein
MKNFKILIVDDDIDVINVLQTILEHEGYTVITANDKTAGLEKARTENPDLAILDVMMTTQFEGFELAKVLTEDEAFKNMPVIMQTSIDVLTTTKGSVQEMAREFRMDPQFQELQVLLIKDANSGESGIDYKNEEGKSIWLNVNDFLRKPIDSSKLLPEINRLLAN